MARRKARDSTDSSLLDAIDSVLNHGAVLQGDLILGVGGVDLIYTRLSVLLAAMDKVVRKQSKGSLRSARPPRTRRTPRSK